MRQAFYAGNRTFLDHTLRMGFDVNTVSDGMTVLGRSLLYPMSTVTLWLLENGASATTESPQTGAKPLQLLACRPHGRYLLNIAKRIVELGGTRADHADSHDVLYHRAINDNYYDVADFLRNHHQETSSNDPLLLRQLLVQNSDRAVDGIKYLLHSRSSHLQGIPVIDDSSKNTPFHIICSIDEDIRDDALNLRVIRILLQEIGTATTLDYVNKNTETAINCAIKEGNYNALQTLLQAGANLDVGEVLPKFQTLARLIYPKVFTSGFRGLSKRYRRQRRYEDNTIRTLIVLLKHISRNSAMSHVAARNVIESQLTHWRSVDFARSCMARALSSSINGEDVKITTINGRLVVDKADGTQWPLEDLIEDSDEFFHELYRFMWDQIESYWNHRFPSQPKMSAK
jgi:hypothetical protein